MARFFSKQAVDRIGFSSLNVIIHALLYCSIYECFRVFIKKPAFPPLSQLISAAVNNVPAPFAYHMGATLSRWTWVFAGGAVGGVLIGILVGFWAPIHRFLSFDIDFYRSLPATLLTSFILAAMGDNNVSRSLPAFYIVFVNIVFLVSKHVRALDKTRIVHLQDYGFGNMFILRHCVVPELLSPVMIAIRQGASLSFLVLVSVELIVGPYEERGLGAAFYQWRDDWAYDNIIVGLAAVGLVGYIFNKVLLVIHRRLVRWESVSS